MKEQYEIVTIADLVEVVNGDNYEALIQDLTHFLSTVALIKGSKKTGVGCDRFVWVDDGEHKATMNFSHDGKQLLQINIDGGVKLDDQEI